MTSAGRPAQGNAERETFCVDAALKKRLRKQRERTGVPTSEFVRRIVVAALDNEGGE